MHKGRRTINSSVIVAEKAAAISVASQKRFLGILGIIAGIISRDWWQKIYDLIIGLKKK